MSGSKSEILARLRSSLGDPEPRRAAVEQRIAEHRSGPLPRRDAALLDYFVARAEGAAASVARLKGREAVVGETLSYLEQRDLPERLLLAGDDLLQDLHWPERLRVETGTAEADHLACLTRAYAGVAETGSLVLLSGPATPTKLNFLPDHYLCVLRGADVVEHIDGLWARLRAEGRAMPRALNFITGPSRTADVEQTIQLGAHGPRSVHVILLED